jgi:hypothetical protein
MKQTSGRARQRQKPLTEAQRAAAAAREAKLLRIRVALGYAMVAIAVVGGFLLSFWPQVFGLRESNPAIGFGLAALAIFRLAALRAKLRRQAEESAVLPAPSGRKRCASAGNA